MNTAKISMKERKKKRKKKQMEQNREIRIYVHVFN
jgi:hypothetical protein